MWRISPTANVELVQSAAAQNQLARLSQNSRTNSQYPEAPIAEPVIRIESAPKFLSRRMSANGTHITDPINPIKGVNALKAAASVIKTSA